MSRSVRVDRPGGRGDRLALPPATTGAADGFQLAQTVVVVAVIAVSLVVAAPPLLHWTSAVRLRLAAAEIGSALRAARMEAVTAGVRVGIKFRPRDDGRVTFTLHRDGDGDGVRTRDIEDGRDPQLGPARSLRHVGAHVRIGFPPGIEPVDPGDPARRLDRLDDPIRFNRSDIAAFSPTGRSTPGSVYLSDGNRGLAVVRLLAASGRVRVMVYDADDDLWRER